MLKLNAVSCVPDAFRITHTQNASSLYISLWFRSDLLSCCAWSVNRPAAHLKLKQTVVCVFYLIIMCISLRNVYNTKYFGCCFTILSQWNHILSVTAVPSAHSLFLHHSHSLSCHQLYTIFVSLMPMSFCECTFLLIPSQASTSFTFETVVVRRQTMQTKESAINVYVDDRLVLFSDIE